MSQETVMEILSWIIVGLITGSMARAIMPGPAAGELRIAILIGIIGAFVGGSVGTIFPIDQSTQFNFYALLMATNGALYLLFAYRCLALRTARADEKWRP
jgi:uncharacterized membrane protein YeaQ/YmgE (transglycosylase-associated protein family)